MRTLLTFFFVIFLLPFFTYAQCETDLPQIISSPLVVCGQEVHQVHYLQSGAVLECEGSLTGAAGAVFVIQGAAHVKNCHFVSFDTAIYVNSSGSLRLGNSSIENGGKGIYIHSGAAHVTIDGAQFRSLTDESIGISSTDGVHVANSLFDRSAYGIYTYALSERLSVTDSEFISNEHAIILEGKNHLVRDNRFEKNIEGLRGIQVTHSLVQGNTFFQDLSSMIFLQSSDIQLLRNNFFDISTGMTLFGSSENKLEHNTFQKVRQTGAFITASSDKNQVSFNYFENVSGYGIFINDSEENVFQNNTFRAAQFFAGSQAENNLFCLNNEYLLGGRGPPCAQPQEELVTTVPLVQENLSKTMISDELQREVMSPPPKFPETKGAFQEAILDEVELQPLNVGLSKNDVETILQEIFGESNSQSLTTLAKKVRQTLSKIVLNKSVQTLQYGDEVYSRVRTSMTFKTTMYDVSIYEKIPKSCAQSIDDIILDERLLEKKGVRFEIINPDPLIVWRFDKIEEGEQITLGYTVKNKVVELPQTVVVENENGILVVNEELMCTSSSQPQTLPTAGKIGKTIWFYLAPMLLLVLIPGIIFFVNRMRHRMQ